MVKIKVRKSKSKYLNNNNSLKKYLVKAFVKQNKILEFSYWHSKSAIEIHIKPKGNKSALNL